MSKINLVPDFRLEKIKTKRRNFLITFFSAITIIIMVVLVVLLQSLQYVQKYNLERTEKDISKTKDELKEYSDIESMVINIEQGLKAIDEMSKSESKWSLFLPELEKITPNDIRFSDFNQEGTTFKARAEGQNITSLARLIKSLETYKYVKPETPSTPDASNEQTVQNQGKALFKNIVVTGYTKEGSDNFIKFEISFELEEGILW